MIAQVGRSPASQPGLHEVKSNPWKLNGFPWLPPAEVDWPTRSPVGARSVSWRDRLPQLLVVGVAREPPNRMLPVIRGRPGSPSRLSGAACRRRGGKTKPATSGPSSHHRTRVGVRGVWPDSSRHHPPGILAMTCSAQNRSLGPFNEMVDRRSSWWSDLPAARLAAQVPERERTWHS
jgi:hypothetical protein